MIHQSHKSDPPASFSIAIVRRSLVDLVKDLRNEDCGNRELQILEQFERISAQLGRILEPVKSPYKTTRIFPAGRYGVARELASRVAGLVTQARLSFQMRDTKRAIDTAEQALTAWQSTKQAGRREEK